MGARLLPVLLLIIRFLSAVTPLKASTLQEETKTQISKAVEQSVVQPQIESKIAPPYPYLLQSPNFHQGIQPPPKLSSTNLGRSATVVEHNMKPPQYHRNHHLNPNNYVSYGEENAQKPKYEAVVRRKPSTKVRIYKGDRKKRKSRIKKEPIETTTASEKKN